MSAITSFIKHHYRHFNAAALVDAAEGYNAHLASGGKMFVTIAGAMSTAELGLVAGGDDPAGQGSRNLLHRRESRRGCFQSRGARFLRARAALSRSDAGRRGRRCSTRHMNRVTDTCIPEMEAMRRIENEVLKEWVRADKAGERYFPHEFMYKILLSGELKSSTRSIRRTAGCWRRRRRICRCSCRAGKTRRWATCMPATASRAT